MLGAKYFPFLFILCYTLYMDTKFNFRSDGRETAMLETMLNNMGWTYLGLCIYRNEGMPGWALETFGSGDEQEAIIYFDNRTFTGSFRYDPDYPMQDNCERFIMWFWLNIKRRNTADADETLKLMGLAS